MTLLQDRVVLISDGTRGLGAGIARAAAREGAMVAVTGRQRESARRIGQTGWRHGSDPGPAAWPGPLALSGRSVVFREVLPDLVQVVRR
jgi:NAD(P)-dependent dehydrogenase (short-subunit alcohol dehydrogenase family)